MKCHDVRERFSCLAEDDLPAEEALAVRAHIADCPACSGLWREVHGLVDELHAWPLPAVSPGLRQRITLALDAVDESSIGLPGFRRSPWEAVLPYVAAAAVIALAFAGASYLHQPRAARMIARAPARPVERPALTLVPTRPAEGPVTPLAPTPAVAPDPTKAEHDAVAEAIRKLEEAQRKAALAAGDRHRWSPDAPPREVAVSRPPREPEPASSPNGKPPGAFAFDRAGEPATAPVRTPTEPVGIELSFAPPDDPSTGAVVEGVIEIIARDAIPNAVVTATGDEGLTIDKPGGVLYRGPLAAGEPVRVPVPMNASTAGAHEVNIAVDSDAPGGDAQLKVFLPGFSGQAAPRPQEDPADRPVTLDFHNATVRQAFTDIAREARLRVEVPEGVGTERVSRGIRGVPARAALRAIAEAGGYQLTEKDGVFRLSRPAKP